MKDSLVKLLAAGAASAPASRGKKQLDLTKLTASKKGNIRSVVAPALNKTAARKGKPVGVEVKVKVEPNACRFNSVLMLVGERDLELSIQQAAQATRCQAQKMPTALCMRAVPVFLAIIDPQLATKEDWDLLCEGLSTRGSEDVKILLTRPCPYTATIPPHLTIPTPKEIDSHFLELLMSRLRAPLPSIARLAPFYPAVIAQLSHQFIAEDFWRKLLGQQSRLICAALEVQLSVRAPHLRVDALPQDTSSPDGVLAHNCISTVCRLICRQLNDFPHLVKSEGGELGPDVWPDEEMLRVWEKVSR